MTKDLCNTPSRGTFGEASSIDDRPCTQKCDTREDSRRDETRREDLDLDIVASQQYDITYRAHGQAKHEERTFDVDSVRYIVQYEQRDEGAGIWDDGEELSAHFYCCISTKKPG